MPCACNSGSRWVAVRPNGTTSQPYRTFNEAQADVQRNGGSVRKTA